LSCIRKGKLHTQEFHNLYSPPKWDWRGKQHVWGRDEAYRGFWWENLRERDHLEDPDVDGRIILRWIFRKWDVRTWNGSSWLRIGTGGGHL
jgi:hypothetical protein